MKVLLVYPECIDNFFSYKHILKYVNKKSFLPPLGLLTVASILPSKWEKKLVDLNIRELNDTDLEWADFVFISAMIIQKKTAGEIIRKVKAKGKFIVAGGTLFTIAYKDFNEVDCLVLNEGEITLPMFLRDLEAGNWKLESGSWSRIYSSDEKPDLSISPIPDWSLIDFNNYLALPLQISRGCPFNCEFCSIIEFNGRVPRYKNPEQVIAELDAIYNTGFRGNIFIVDDNFIGNKIKVKLVLKKLVIWMEEKKFPFYLDTQVSINLANDMELIELMRISNFSGIAVGIETLEEESLKSCGKIQNTNIDLKEKVKILHRNGFQVTGDFIIGFDTDTQFTFEKIFQFVQESGIVIPIVGVLNAFPGTQLHKRLLKEGRILGNAIGNHTDFSLNFIPKMKKEVLYSGYEKLLNSIFNQKNYYDRIITFLKEYNNYSRDRKLIIGLYVKLFFLVFWKLGIKDKGMIYFWRMILWTLYRKPHLLPQAIKFSIFCSHYSKTLQQSKYSNQEA